MATQMYCLGKKPAVYDSRTLNFGAYLGATMPPPPATANWGKSVSAWPMYYNDQYGDCTCAAAGHMIQAWSAAAKKPRTPTKQAVLNFYKHFTTPGPENGCNMLDVLKYWRSSGLGRDKITGFAALEPKNATEVEDAVYVFGGCYIGVALPKFAVSGSNPLTVPWVVPPQGPVGEAAPDQNLGHCICAVAYDPRNLYVVTWGAVKSMSWQFYNAYADESYAILSGDFLSGDRKAPNGFDLKQLQADLSEVARVPASRAAMYRRML
jgi:hypothetical protein